MNPGILVTSETVKNTVYSLAQANNAPSEAKVAETSLGRMLADYVRAAETPTNWLSRASLLEIELVLMHMTASREIACSEIATNALRAWRLELKRQQRSEW